MHDNNRPCAHSGSAPRADQAPVKPAFEEPKLTPRGDLREVTGFFGPFSP